MMSGDGSEPIEVIKRPMKRTGSQSFSGFAIESIFNPQPIAKTLSIKMTCQRPEVNCRVFDVVRVSYTRSPFFFEGGSSGRDYNEQTSINFEFAGVLSDLIHKNNKQELKFNQDGFSFRD